VTKRKSILLSVLMRRVRAATSEKGARKALAIKLGITPQAMNDWLSERFAPGGEAALLLLEWVSAAEAKQKKSRGNAQTSPQPMAQQRKSDEEKPKSGRKR
jgi:hypothetical protein